MPRAPAKPFNDFVKDLLSRTSEEAQPVDIADDQAFEVDEDGSAFDDVLGVEASATGLRASDTTFVVNG